MNADQLLYNVSRRRLQRMAPQRAVTVMVPDVREPGKYQFITVQDTTAIERECQRLRNASPDLSVVSNKSDGKWLHSSGIPRGIIEKVVGYRNWTMAPPEEKAKMEKRILQEYPSFCVTGRKNIGL